MTNIGPGMWDLIPKPPIVRCTKCRTHVTLSRHDEMGEPDTCPLCFGRYALVTFESDGAEITFPCHE
jgi:hypothetical protein